MQYNASIFAYIFMQILTSYQHSKHYAKLISITLYKYTCKTLYKTITFVKTKNYG